MILFRHNMFAVLSLLMVLVIGACSQNSDAGKKEGNTVVLSVASVAQFDSLLTKSGSRLLVFDLYADWCMPCRILSPILEQLAAENKARVSIFKVNVDKMAQLTARYGVNGIPYVLYIKNSQVVASFMGVQPRETYQAAIDRFSSSDTASAQPLISEAQEAKPGAFESVTAKQAIQLIDSAHAFVLDVRSVEEFAQEHINNATLIPVNELAGRIGELAAYKSKPILVYCRSGNRSSVAARLLQQQGFTNIYNLQLGLIGWKQAKLPLTR